MTGPFSPASLRVARFASIAEMREVSAAVVELLHQHLGDGRHLSSYPLKSIGCPTSWSWANVRKLRARGSTRRSSFRGTATDLSLDVVARLMGECRKVRKQGSRVHERHRSGREIR